jgi:hypothetical protein
MASTFLQGQHVEQDAAQMGQNLHARHKAGEKGFLTEEVLQHVFVEPVNANPRTWDCTAGPSARDVLP